MVSKILLKPNHKISNIALAAGITIWTTFFMGGCNPIEKKQEVTVQKTEHNTLGQDTRKKEMDRFTYAGDEASPFGRYGYQAYRWMVDTTASLLKSQSLVKNEGVFYSRIYKLIEEKKVPQLPDSIGKYCSIDAVKAAEIMKQWECLDRSLFFWDIARKDGMKVGVGLAYEKKGAWHTFIVGETIFFETTNGDCRPLKDMKGYYNSYGLKVQKIVWDLNGVKGIMQEVLKELEGNKEKKN